MRTRPKIYLKTPANQQIANKAVNTQRHSLPQTAVIKHEVVMVTNGFFTDYLRSFYLAAHQVVRRLFGIITSSGGGGLAFKGDVLF